MRVPTQQHSTARLDRVGTEKEIALYTESELNMWRDLADVESTTQGFFRAKQYGGFANAPVVNAGAYIPTDDWQDPYYKDIIPLKRAIQYLVASETEETDQTTISSKAVKALGLAMVSTKEQVVADQVNNMTSTSTIYVGGDGKALVATDHPTDSGTWSNRPATDIAFGALNLEQAIQELAAQDNHRGEPMPSYGPFILIVPLALMGLAHRVVESSGLAESANNDKNWAGARIKKIHCNPRLTSTTAWALKDVNKENIVLVQARPVRVKNWDVGEKDGRAYSITERYAAGNVGARGFWGTTG